MSYPMPVHEGAITAPKTCEMCGQMVEPDTRTLIGSEAPREVLRYLSAMWFEDALAAQIVLLRIGAPSWTYAQMAAQLTVSKAKVGRAVQDILRGYPELATLMHIHAAQPAAQRQRREREREQVGQASAHLQADRLEDELRTIRRQYRRRIRALRMQEAMQ